MRLSKKIYGLIVPCLCLVSFLVPSSALAAGSGPQWSVSGVSRPTVFVVGAGVGEDYYSVLVTNTGGAAADCTEAQHDKEEVEKKGSEVCPVGSPVVSSVTITDELPVGLGVVEGAVTGEDELLVEER